MLIWLARAPAVLTGQDDARYILLGRALWSLRYIELWQVDLPTHHVYPPGFPLVLALTGHRFALIIALNALFSAAAIGLTALVVRRLWSERAGLVCLAVLAVNPVLVHSAGTARSEILFTLLSCGALALACLQGAERAGRSAGAAALSIAAALTRSIGVTLLAGIGLHWLLQRRWKAFALFLVAGSLTVGLWLWWTTQAPAAHVGESYVADVTAQPASQPGLLRTFMIRMRWNATIYATRSVPSATGFPAIPATVADNAASLLLLPLAVVGLIAAWRSAPPVVLSLAFTAALLWVWPWASTRFLVPLVPLLVPVMLLGAAVIGRRLRPAWSWPALAVLALVLAAGGVTRTTRLLASAAQCDRSRWQSDAGCVHADQASFFAAAVFIRDSIPENAVVLSAKPEPLYLYTGRRTTPARSAVTIPPDSLVGWLARNRSRYVLIGSLQAFEIDELPDLLEPNCHRMRVRRFFPPRTWLLELSDGRGAGNACGAITRWRSANINRNFDLDQ